MYKAIVRKANLKIQKSKTNSIGQQVVAKREETCKNPPRTTFIVSIGTTRSYNYTAACRNDN